MAKLMITPAMSAGAWLRFSLIERIISNLPIHSVLEIGIGLGAIGSRLAARFDYIGVEPDYQSFRVAAARLNRPDAIRVLHGDISAVSRDRQFDLVCAFEVLEHIRDDLAALKTWRPLIRPEGWLLISVPAHRKRFGPSDARVGHYRRYDMLDLVRLLEDAGFTIVDIQSYGFPLGHFLEWIRNRMARASGYSALPPAADVEIPSNLIGTSGRWLQPNERLAWATWLGTLPFRIFQRPFVHTNLGIGHIALAQRSP